MPVLNIAHLNAVLEFINNGPYFKHLNMVVTEMGIGYSTLEMELEKAHMSPFDSLHGGAAASAIDTACYWSIYSECHENAGLITLDLHIDYLSTAETGTLVVRGRRTKIGKTICLAEATIVDKNDKWIAHGSSKLLVRQDLQNPTESIKRLTGEDIPPKFI
jgi:uncharacterized protein (TIGR00369 family)